MEKGKDRVGRKLQAKRYSLLGHELRGRALWETGVRRVLEARPQSPGFLLCEKEGPLKDLSRKISGSDL